MINLIPIEEKKKRINNFYFRVLAVFFISIGISLFIASVSILPAYFISSVKENLANLNLETQKNQIIPELDQEAVLAVKVIDDKLKIIENSIKNKFIVSDKVIKAILIDKTNDIKITQIFYKYDKEKGKTISIKGIAPSRERLLLFSRVLENNSLFSKVDLPISNFIKGSNIQFYLNLISS